MRHPYATLSLDAGIDLKIVSDRIGHANVSMTAQIYGHRSTGQDGPAANKMAALFLDFLTPPAAPPSPEVAPEEDKEEEPPAPTDLAG